MKATTVCGLGAALLFAMPVLAEGTTQYNNRATFEAALGTIILDDYTAAGYLAGDVINNATLDIHSNANMSGIVGETDYRTTGHTNGGIGWNIILSSGTNRYCAGCNGSYELGFTTTSVGTASGVYGAGLDIVTNSNYYAFVTFGDNSTLNVALATSGFWGITSNLDIKSIHIGLSGGGSTTGGYMEMTNLTIGDVPAPGVLAMLGLGGFAYRRRRRR